MGLYSDILEQNRERMIALFDVDPCMGISISHSNGRCGIAISKYYNHNSTSYRGYSFESKDYSKTSPVCTFEAKDYSEEIIICSSLIFLCKTQNEALSQILNAKEPRSNSFLYWFDWIRKSISARDQEAKDHLQQINRQYSRNHGVKSVPIHETEEKIILSAIDHVYKEEIKYQTATRNEMINIVDDASWYITNILNNPVDNKSKNDVVSEFFKEKYHLSLRGDHCCPNCGSDLYKGVPYCMKCNTVLAR